MTHGYHWTEDYVLFELPGAKGWVYFAWLLESDPWLDLERETDGYIAQEWQARL